MNVILLVPRDIETKGKTRFTVLRALHIQFNGWPFPNVKYTASVLYTVWHQRCIPSLPPKTSFVQVLDNIFSRNKVCKGCGVTFEDCVTLNGADEASLLYYGLFVVLFACELLAFICHSSPHCQ